MHLDINTFNLDHIMIETDDPEKWAKEFSEAFELPYAWPFSEGKDYSSVGINFGQIIIEFIRLSKELVISNDNSLNFEICIVNQK